MGYNMISQVIRNVLNHSHNIMITSGLITRNNGQCSTMFHASSEENPSFWPLFMAWLHLVEFLLVTASCRFTTAANTSGLSCCTIELSTLEELEDLPGVLLRLYLGRAWGGVTSILEGLATAASLPTLATAFSGVLASETELVTRQLESASSAESISSFTGVVSRLVRAVPKSSSSKDVSLLPGRKDTSVACERLDRLKLSSSSPTKPVSSASSWWRWEVREAMELSEAAPSRASLPALDRPDTWKLSMFCFSSRFCRLISSSSWLLILL